MPRCSYQLLCLLDKADEPIVCIFNFLKIVFSFPEKEMHLPLN